MKAILMIIFGTTVVGGGLAGFGYFIWLLFTYNESHYEDDVRLSFQDFQRIYSLAPDKWERHDYSFSRREWNGKNGCDYDGASTVEDFRLLVKELVYCSQKARDCLWEGKLFGVHGAPDGGYYG